MPNRADEIAALPPGTKLPEIKDLPGFAEWRASPITAELLARLDAKIVAYAKDVEKLKPCTACGAEKPVDQREHLAYLGGVIMGMNAAAAAVSGMPRVGFVEP